MANETVETSCTEEDDYHENIPPGPSRPLYTVSTPASKNQGKVNPPLPEVPSALTPFFKYMNIANRFHSPKPLKCVNNPVQDVPQFRFGAGGLGTASNWLFDEALPEITLLDDTCDLGSPCNSRLYAASNASHSVIVTAVKTPPEKSPEAPPALSKREERLSWLDVKNFPEITLLDDTHENQSPPAARLLPNDSNQDVEVNDSTSKLSGQTDQSDPGQSAASQSEESSRVSVQSDKYVEDNTTKTSLVDNPDVTVGGVLENSKSSLEQRGETFDKIQTSSLENTSCSQPANVTYNLSCGSMSAQDAQLSTSDMKCNPNTSKTPPSPSTAGAANGTFTLSQPSNGTFTLSQPSNGTFTLSHPSNLSLSTVLSSTAPMSPPQNHTIDLPQPDLINPEMKSDAADQTSSVPTETSLINNPMCSDIKESDSKNEPHSSAERQSPQKSSGSPAVEEPVELQNTIEYEKLSTQKVSVSLSESSSTDRHQETIDKHSLQVCNLTTSLKEGPSEVPPPEESGSHGTGSATNPADEANKCEDICEVDPVLDASPTAARRESEDHSKSVLAKIDYSANSINHQSLITETNKAHTFNLDETLDLEGKPQVTSTPIVNHKVSSGIPQHEEGRNPAAQKKLLGEDPVKAAAQAAPQAPPDLASDHKALLKQQTNVAKPRLPPPKLASELLKNRVASALPGRFQLVTSGPPMTRQRLQTEASRNATDAPNRTVGTSGSYNLRATTTGLKLPASGLPRPQQSGIPSGIQRLASGLKKPSARGSAQAPEKPAVMPSTAAGSSAASDAASRARALKPPIKSQKAVTTKPQAPAATPGPKTLQSKKHPLPRNEAVPSSKKPKMDAVVSSRNPESSAACQTDACNDQTGDAAVPSSAAGSSSGCDAATRALKPPATTQKAVTTKSQAHGCANCTLLEKQNKVMAEEIKRLNEELLKLQTK